MTRVKDQKTCTACAAFASVASLEAAINLYANYQFDSIEDTRFSERHAFNCSKYKSGITTVGCNCDEGKGISLIYDFFKDIAIVDSDCYPYESPICEDTGASCEIVAQQKCDTPSMTAQIWSYKRYQITQGDSIQRADSLKVKIMTDGPLSVTLKNWPGPDSAQHAVSLIGFETKNDTLYWIYKNSWDTTFGDKGYGKEPFWIGTGAPSYIPSIGSSVYAINYDDTCSYPPITVICHRNCVTPNFTYYVHDYDKDKDGFFNWGIGQRPDTYPCSQEEDSNDDDNRIGPYDDNYSGLAIMPDIKVKQGTSQWGGAFENGAVINISVDTLYDSTFVFQIGNAGTAQLNLVQYQLSDSGVVTIDYQYPEGQFSLVDLPHKFVCMSDTSTFKIKMFHGAAAGALAHVHIYLDEPDMDSIFEFTIVYNGCETSSGYDSITSEIEWNDTCRAQCRDLHIMRTGELTVLGMVRLSPEADIIVEPGGKLIVDGGCLTRACNSQLWKGIQVWGDSSLSQYPDTNQGFVSVVNGGQIEYAQGGIFAGRADDGDTLYAYSGGTIYAEKAVFLNNVIDVEFLPFINRTPGNQEMENLSHFRDCIFRTHDPDGLIEKVSAHAILDGVNGVDFYTSTFEMEETEGNPFETDGKGIGIWATDAEFNVRGMCDTNTIPCIHYDSCYFKNLRYGILATNSGGNNYVWVTETVFDNNIAGIYLSGYHQPSVYSSRFYTCTEQGPPGDLDDAFLGGLYLEGSTGYQVEENYFAGPLTTMPDSGSIATIGIYIKDSGDDENEIYNNYFTGLDAGIIAEGVNRGDKTGLCLKCNDYRTCLNDMLVIEGDSNSRYLGIKEYQGTDDTLSSALAGNTFTSDVQGLQAVDNGGNKKYYWSYFNDADHINYYHHGQHPFLVTYPSDSNYTDNTITLNNKQTPYLKEEACPSGISNPELKSIEDPRLSINEADQQLQLLENKFDSLVDGGDTEGLDFEIMTSMPDEALELQQQLLSGSPYLSDTVMKQAIYKENVLPNAMIRDILSVNPQSAKSGEILDALDSRYDPMPDYMMANIMQGLHQIGALESLESKIGYWQNYRSRAVNRLVREYLSDSTLFNTEDSLIGLYQDENTLQSKYRLAFSYWDDENMEQAQNALSAIPGEFNLSSQEQTVYQNYLDFFNILQLMSDSSLHARQLDFTAVQQLVNIMNTGLPLVSNYARALLIKGRHIEYTESVYFPMVVKKYPSYYSQNSKKEGIYEDNRLFLFPNPCGDYIIAYFNTIEQGHNGNLVLYDLNGKELDRIRLNSTQNQRVINLFDHPNGTYIIRLLVDYQPVSTKLLIKGRK
ncbi:MAG TPA: C1 family peptidase [Bacteroidales bacterium]|nr:C1 family peptidase [Bacteroidales bacterium]